MRNDRDAVILSRMPSSPKPVCAATLAWRVWPAREWPLRTLLATAIITGLAIASALLFASSTAAGVAVGALLLANIRFFCPSNYEVDAESITLSGLFGTRKLALEDIRLSRFDAQGGLLSERTRPGPFANLRGLPLLFPREGGAMIAHSLKQQLAQHAREKSTP
ncbi:MAG: hypothetical protein EXS10_06475 [Phycisphaerales bacterium]|nr:hypothetical protein [Phycisphaerales bacterium]